MVEVDNQTELLFRKRGLFSFRSQEVWLQEASLLIPVLMQTQLFVFHCHSEVRQTHFHEWIFIQRRAFYGKKGDPQ